MSETHQAEKVDDATAIALWGQVVRGYRTTSARFCDAIGERFSLTVAEADALLSMHREPGYRASMVHLARATDFTSGGFTKLADKLAKRGLAARVPCEADRRVTFLELTPQGEEVAAELAALVADTNRTLFVDVLGPERAEVVARAMAELFEANARTDV